MVPIREVATWRSYVNIAATTGRSLGGPIGGYLTDTIGWRWYGFTPFKYYTRLSKYVANGYEIGHSLDSVHLQS